MTTFTQEIRKLVVRICQEFVFGLCQHQVVDRA